MDEIKKIIRRNKPLETFAYYFYTRFSFIGPSFKSFILSLFISFIRKNIIKKDIISLTISNADTFITLSDKRNFYWNPRDRNSLIGLALIGEWEPDETDYLKKVTKKGNVVVDVGGNYGLYAILFSQLVGENGSVHVFEPLVYMIQDMRKNIANNNCHNNIQINNAGLSDTNGTASFYVYTNLGPGAASSRKRWFGSYSTYESKMLKLDDYVRQNKLQRVDAIKCDVEGAELLVFKGAEKTLQKFHPTLLFEVTGAGAKFGYRQTDLFDFLKKVGYKFYFFNKSKLEIIKDTANFYGYCVARN
ncbi:MAG: FkbM family methyltransferase [Ktedonobacteraceae bacterium]